MTVELYPHQRKAVEQLGNGKILWGDVGTGKSLAAMAYFFEKVCDGIPGDFVYPISNPMDIYVITTAKKRDHGDWDEEAHKFGIGKERDASIGGIKLTVDSWNNLNKYKEIKNAFFLFDEQRLVGSGAWVKSFIQIAKHNQWIMLSATPGDTWLDYIPVFVANGFYKNRTEFKREHVVYNTYSKFPKVDRYINTGRLIRLRNQLLVHMPYERHTVRHSRQLVVDYDKELFDKVVNKRWHVYENRPIRDVAELFIVMRKVVNSDSSRLESLRTILSTHRKVIVFYNFDYELHLLRSLAEDPMESTRPLEKSSSKSSVLSTIISGNGSKNSSSEIINQIEPPASSAIGSENRSIIPATLNSFSIAEWNGHKHQPIPETESWVYLVQYQAGAEGWNCVSTDAMCFYSLTYSYKLWHQAHGRIDRLNTPFTDLNYYTLMSNSLIDKAIWRSIRAKRSFNEASFMNSLG